MREPSLEPESSASANSAISAYQMLLFYILHDESQHLGRLIKSLSAILKILHGENPKQSIPLNLLEYNTILTATCQD